MGENTDKIIKTWKCIAVEFKANFFFSLKLFVFSVGIFFLLGVGIYFISPLLMNGKYDTLTLLSGLSTYFVALFTLIYVFTSSRQLDVMIAQVNEMQKDRLLQSQPVLCIQNSIFSAESPRLWGILPYTDCRIFSRYHFKFQLKNIGLNPAVGIALSGKVYTKKSKLDLKTVSVRKEFLQPSEETDIESLNSFLFAGDEKNQILNNLLPSRDTEHVYFKLTTIYKNALGGSFRVTETYALFLTSEASTTVKDWLSNLAAFEIKHKPDIERINARFKSQPEEMIRFKEKLKGEYLEIIPETSINIALHPIPGSIQLDVINAEKYEELNEEMGHSGTPIALMRSTPCRP